LLGGAAVFPGAAASLGASVLSPQPASIAAAAPARTNFKAVRFCIIGELQKQKFEQ